MVLMSLTHVFFAEPGGAVVTVRLNDEPSGFETEPETWVEPNKCKLQRNRETGKWSSSQSDHIRAYRKSAPASRRPGRVVRLQLLGRGGGNWRIGRSPVERLAAHREDSHLFFLSSTSRLYSLSSRSTMFSQTWSISSTLRSPNPAHIAGSGLRGFAGVLS